jgi:hypothetical protein
MRFRFVLPILSLAAGPALAQFPPDSTVNLKVLPRDIPVRELINTMRGFTNALGVRCQHCHIGEEGEPLAEFDFVSDDMPAKLKAREMLRMVAQINGEWLADLPRRGTPAVEVACVTCHRGQARPIMLEDLLAQVGDSAGADAAVVRYRELRDQFFGGFTYDFGPDPVNAAAGRLLRTGHPADARTMLGLNAEYHPDDLEALTLLGQAELALGDTAAAVAALERALAIQPRNPMLRRLLSRLKPGG